MVPVRHEGGVTGSVAEAMGWSEGDELNVQIAGRDVLRLSKGG